MRKMNGFRKLLALVICAAMAAGLVPGLMPAAKALGGKGTVENPYKIYDASDLEAFRDIVNGSNGATKNTAAYATLEEDITLSGTWTPIADSIDDNPDSRYTGIFYGQGHEITGLVTARKNYQGLFGCIGTGAVSDVLVIGAVTAAISAAGCVSGRVFGNRLGSRSSIFGGAVLLAIAVKIMFFG